MRSSQERGIASGIHTSLSLKKEREKFQKKKRIQIQSVGLQITVEKGERANSVRDGSYGVYRHHL